MDWLLDENEVLRDKVRELTEEIKALKSKKTFTELDYEDALNEVERLKAENHDLKKRFIEHYADAVSVIDIKRPSWS